MDGMLKFRGTYRRRGDWVADASVPLTSFCYLPGEEQDDKHTSAGAATGFARTPGPSMSAAARRDLVICMMLEVVDSGK